MRGREMIEQLPKGISPGQPDKEQLAKKGFLDGTALNA